jgi:hypothetical protein
MRRRNSVQKHFVISNAILDVLFRYWQCHLVKCQWLLEKFLRPLDVRKIWSVLNLMLLLQTEGPCLNQSVGATSSSCSRDTSTYQWMFRLFLPSPSFVAHSDLFDLSYLSYVVRPQSRFPTRPTASKPYIARSDCAYVIEQGCSMALVLTVLPAFSQ